MRLGLSPTLIYPPRGPEAELLSREATTAIVTLALTLGKTLYKDYPTSPNRCAASEATLP